MLHSPTDSIWLPGNEIAEDRLLPIARNASLGFLGAIGSMIQPRENTGNQEQSDFQREESSNDSTRSYIQRHHITGEIWEIPSAVLNVTGISSDPRTTEKSGTVLLFLAIDVCREGFWFLQIRGWGLSGARSHPARKYRPKSFPSLPRSKSFAESKG